MTLAGHRERLGAKKPKWLKEEEIELRVLSERNLAASGVGPFFLLNEYLGLLVNPPVPNEPVIGVALRGATFWTAALSP